MATRKTKINRVWVVKVGSAIFIEGGPLLIRAWMRQIAQLKKEHDIDVVWVTSGAIASAKSRISKSWERLPQKQALSAIGQPILMDSYNLALQSMGLIGAQVLLTYDDIARKEHRHNLRNTICQLIEWKIVPILNENDAVATEEIQFGDNDLLSAKVAGLLGAENLVIMTNVDGLYDRNPEKHRDAKAIPHLPRVTKTLLDSMDKNAVSKVGRGGMYSKIRAAAYAQKQDVPTWIVRGDMPDNLLKIARGEWIGTRVGPAPAELTRRKRR